MAVRAAAEDAIGTVATVIARLNTDRRLAQSYGATDTVHYVCEHALDARHYFRFQTPVKNTFVRGMDDVRMSNLKDLRDRALAYLQRGEGKRKLAALVSRLNLPRATAVPLPPEPPEDLPTRRARRRAASELVRARL